MQYKSLSEQVADLEARVGKQQQSPDAKAFDVITAALVVAHGGYQPNQQVLHRLRQKCREYEIATTGQSQIPER